MPHEPGHDGLGELGQDWEFPLDDGGMIVIEEEWGFDDENTGND